MYDVTALGELLIDFTPYNSSQPGKIAGPNSRMNRLTIEKLTKQVQQAAE